MNDRDQALLKEQEEAVSKLVKKVEEHRPTWQARKEAGATLSSEELSRRIAALRRPVH